MNLSPLWTWIYEPTDAASLAASRRGETLGHDRWGAINARAERRAAVTVLAGLFAVVALIFWLGYLAGAGRS